MNPTTDPNAKPSPLPSTTKPGSGWLGPEHMKNREMLPLTELEKWAGQHVAWNWEGTRIVAGAATGDALLQELTRLGIDWQTVVFSYVDEPGATYL